MHLLVLLLFTTIISITSTTTTTCTMKSIAQIIPKANRHWVGDGFHVRPVFNALAFTKHISPFLMLDYANENFEPNNNPKKRKGVGQHPHRGFETVTIAFQGEIEHADSVGNRDVIGTGDVQWMTAGRGIIHEEFHGIDWAKKGGTVEMVQLWVNLEAKNKMVAPTYQALSNESIPKIELKNEKTESKIGTLRIIAGTYKEANGPGTTHSEMNVWDIELNGEDESLPFELDIPEKHNSMLFVRSGSIELSDETGKKTTVGDQQLVLFNMDGNAIRITTKDKAKIMFLSGVPFFEEPIANMGPFVMNTREELRQAQVDYRNGNFGT